MEEEEEEESLFNKRQNKRIFTNKFTHGNQANALLQQIPRQYKALADVCEHRRDYLMSRFYRRCLNIITCMIVMLRLLKFLLKSGPLIQGRPE
jgi:hypothetical protein